MYVLYAAFLFWPSILSFFSEIDTTTALNMKLEVLLASFICIGLASASLVDVLNSLHQNQNFKLLNQTAQILIVELIAATEANELKNYIDTVGFSKVLNMIDRKSFYAMEWPRFQFNTTCRK